MEKSGILLINKESGMTSNDVIQKIKKKLNVNKIGHAGTLDPMATGLLIVLINQATKVSNYFLANEKIYRFKMKFFIETDSHDITGKIVKSIPEIKILKKDINKIIKKFNGYIYEQEPPIFSAIKINGKKMLNYALNDKINELGEIKKRTVQIKKMELIDINKKTSEIEVRTCCSKGTYIRSLVRDMAIELNTIATTSMIERESSGKFSINNAKKINEIEEKDIINLYDAITISNYPLIKISSEQEIFDGKPIKLINIKNDFVFIINKKNDVLAVYEKVANELYACKRGLWSIDFKTLTDAERERNI